MATILLCSSADVPMIKGLINTNGRKAPLYLELSSDSYFIIDKILKKIIKNGDELSNQDIKLNITNSSIFGRLMSLAIEI